MEFKLEILHYNNVVEKVSRKKLNQIIRITIVYVLHVPQLVHPIRRFEIFRKTVIHPCNDFVDGFFPRGFRVLAGNDGLVEFPKCGLDDNSKVIGHLKQEKEHIERDNTATTTCAW